MWQRAFRELLVLGQCNQIAKIAGKGTIGFSDCTFAHWDRNKEGRHALQIESGNVVVRGCEFQQDKAQISLSRDVKRAVISENIMRGKLRVTNESKGAVIVKDNASDEQNIETGKSDMTTNTGTQANSFGVRRQAERDAAMVERLQLCQSKAPSPLRSAGAVHTTAVILGALLLSACAGRDAASTAAHGEKNSFVVSPAKDGQSSSQKLHRLCRLRRKPAPRRLARTRFIFAAEPIFWTKHSSCDLNIRESPWWRIRRKAVLSGGRRITAGRKLPWTEEALGR